MDKKGLRKLTHHELMKISNRKKSDAIRKYFLNADPSFLKKMGLEMDERNDVDPNGYPLIFWIDNSFLENENETKVQATATD